MMLSKADRNRAFRISTAIVAGYQPERTELELVAQTVLDCAEAFKNRLAPVYHAALLAWPADGYEHWPERLKLQRIVKACRDWELLNGEMPVVDGKERT
jgi:hypothetical protein